MAYFVTGATGFIGRHLVDRLLEREGDIHVLVRDASLPRLHTLIAGWEQTHGSSVRERVRPVSGDLLTPLLGVSDAHVADLKDQIDHFFHLAAIYDMTASSEHNLNVNVGGTNQAVELAKALNAGCLHHVSSIAVAGDYRGLFREDMFDEGQKLPSPYHATKYESERIVRDQQHVPWRVYRPSIVLGHSKTGEMDKIDGPYYFFKAIQRLRHWLPEWMPLIGPELGYTNLVPVDFVTDALDHIAHRPGLDSQAFHLTNPRSQRVGETMNEFARAAHAPQLALRIDKRVTDALPKGVFSMLIKLPALRDVRRALLADLGIPDEVIEHIALRPQFDTRDTERALDGSGLEVPPLADYAHQVWDYWERHLDPDLFKDRSLGAAVNGRTVIITGASSGIGRATALKVAAAGGIPLLVARGVEKLEELRTEIEANGGNAYVYGADLSDTASIEALVERILAEHPAVDMLVNNAGRSIRRSVALSYDRFHDYERTIQLNYLGTIKLIIGLLPHMRERGFGHIVNVSSIGVQTNPPRFSAYVASKAALDAFTRVVSSEVVGDGVTFTTIHMPLVRTAMIAPTKMYDSFPAATPEEAADMVCEALRSKPKQINTRLGTFGEVAYALAPKAVDQILHMAYKVFPDSAASRGEKDPNEKASVEQIAMANLMKGVHW
ncbi:MAG TPA: SDR family oxidoreductase [Solirubrobacteraceae bacterium]|nr:SDR family oxidoreductase [Solirubrobacteraceae bacterium]